MSRKKISLSDIYHGNNVSRLRLVQPGLNYLNVRLLVPTRQAAPKLKPVTYATRGLTVYVQSCRIFNQGPKVTLASQGRVAYTCKRLFYTTVGFGYEAHPRTAQPELLGAADANLLQRTMKWQARPTLNSCFFINT
eukprot:g60293.t1